MLRSGYSGRAIRLTRCRSFRFASHMRIGVPTRNFMKRLILLLSTVLLCGCHSSGPPIDMIVPKGFTGPIWIVLDESAPDLSLIDGRYRVTIPVKGVLRTRSFLPFERWHVFTARYDDGSPIPHPSAGSRLNPEMIALRGGHSGVTNKDGREYREIRYFVGTEKQTSDFLVNNRLFPAEGK